MKIALVTDSTSDISQELAQRHKIFLVPNTIIIEGKSYVDGIDITREEFYQQLPTMASHPTTATASPGAYHQLYENLISQGFEKIISIHASSLLSGIINAANTAAQAFDGIVSVVDSQQLSLGLGFQVLAAAESLNQGSTLETILAVIEDVRKRARVVAMLDTLEYVRRSGRVSWTRASLGNLLQVKPFVQVQAGRVVNIGEARTRLKGIERLREFLTKFGPLQKIAILHTNAELDAQKFLQDANIPYINNPLIVNVTTVIGAHIGPNSLGFAAVIQ